MCPPTTVSRSLPKPKHCVARFVRESLRHAPSGEHALLLFRTSSPVQASGAVASHHSPGPSFSLPMRTSPPRSHPTSPRKRHVTQRESWQQSARHFSAVATPFAAVFHGIDGSLNPPGQLPTSVSRRNRHDDDDVPEMSRCTSSSRSSAASMSAATGESLAEQRTRSANPTQSV